jgi:hypothetical protein
MSYEPFKNRAYPERDSNAHCHRPERCASCQLGYPGLCRAAVLRRAVHVPCCAVPSARVERAPPAPSTPSLCQLGYEGWRMPERGAAGRHVDRVAQVVPVSEPGGRSTRRSRPVQAAALVPAFILFRWIPKAENAYSIVDLEQRQ